MKDDLKGKLANLFAEDKKQVEKVTQEKDARAKKEAENLAEFLRLRESTIEPAMREIAEFVEAQGWECEIEKSDEERDRDGRASPAKIAMVFFRGTKPNYYRWHESPYFMVSCVKGSGSVAFNISTISPGSGGSSGPSGSAKFAEVDADLIQTRITDLLGRVLKRLP